MDDKLGEQLVQAADEMDTNRLRDLVDQGASVNYAVPETGVTAFHIAASYGDWDSLNVLLDTGKCNLLLRDNDGYLTSRFASVEAGNIEWSDKLMKMEREQGKAVGIVPRMTGDVPITEIE